MRNSVSRFGVSCNRIYILVQGMRFLKNLFSETDERVQSYMDVFDGLMRQFHDRAAGDTLVVVHRIWEGMKDLGNVFSTWTYCTCLTHMIMMM